MTNKDVSTRVGTLSGAGWHRHLRTAALPAADHVVTLCNQLPHTREAQIRESFAKFRDERSYVLTTPPRCMQRVLQQESGAASSSMTAGFHGFPQNPPNHAPTISLFRCAFDSIFPPFLANASCGIQPNLMPIVVHAESCEFGAPEAAPEQGSVAAELNRIPNPIRAFPCSSGLTYRPLEPDCGPTTALTSHGPASAAHDGSAGGMTAGNGLQAPRGVPVRVMRVDRFDEGIDRIGSKCSSARTRMRRQRHCIR